MPLIRLPLVKKRLLKLVLAIDNPKSTEFSPRYTIYNTVLRQKFGSPGLYTPKTTKTHNF